MTVGLDLCSIVTVPFSSDHAGGTRFRSKIGFSVCVWEKFQKETFTSASQTFNDSIKKEPCNTKGDTLGIMQGRYYQRDQRLLVTLLNGLSLSPFAAGKICPRSPPVQILVRDKKSFPVTYIQSLRENGSGKFDPASLEFLVESLCPT